MVHNVFFFFFSLYERFFHTNGELDLLFTVILWLCIRSAQCKDWDNSGIVLLKVGIPTLSVDSGIALDTSRIAQGM